MQATWSSPVTSRLLLEAGASTYISKWGWMEQPGAILNLNQVQEQAAMNGVFADVLLMVRAFTLAANTRDAICRDIIALSCRAIRITSFTADTIVRRCSSPMRIDFHT